MPTNHLSTYIDERDEEILDLYVVRKWTMERIANHLGISKQAVSARIGKTRQEWKSVNLNRIKEFQINQLQTLEAVEREAWDAWYRSIGTVTRTETLRDPDDNIISTREIIEEQVGDPRFLVQIQNVLAQKAKLLGLNAADAQAASNSVEDKLIQLIKENRVTFEMLANDVGDEMARRFFNLAGKKVPMKSSVVEIDDPDTITIDGDYDIQ